MPQPEIYPSYTSSSQILVANSGGTNGRKTALLHNDRLDPPGCRSTYHTLEIILIVSRVGQCV